MIGIFNNALMITGFVFVMMLTIEYINIQTSGKWQEKIASTRWGQYLLGGVLGLIPGCLGAFTIIAMYSHGIITIGAVVTTMIATSGDEAFVMLALIPKQVILIFIVLLSVGILAGILTDLIWTHKKKHKHCVDHELIIHENDDCIGFNKEKFISQWKSCSPLRGIMTLSVLFIILALVVGRIGPSDWNWIRVSILILSVFSLFIIIIVPDHFLADHLWKHVVIKHMPRIFLWSFGILFILHIMANYFHIEPQLVRGRLIILLVALVVGLIPESGPHLIFVSLYAEGAIPISILIANSVVQDGHGMLPLLAHSRRDFFRIKGINLIFGAILGGIGLIMGW